ncbi:type II secretion system F family protein [Cellulomonas flavigena]|uniref:type II secretion system F family protein n=1 Tax=Cellulomonas flavigena TaxID=1711 RepID=UPI00031E162A|nr:type II secretion system F family protein [Cellulomonas flavigena]
MLELCAAAVRGGAPVPTALAVTGRHLGGADGDALARAGTALALGAPWDAAWAGAPPSVAALARALRGGWDAGASPRPALRAAAAGLRREHRAHVRAAAGALGVRLTLPLGACFLPAFVLLGLVPVVLGLAGDLRAVVP